MSAAAPGQVAGVGSGRGRTRRGIELGLLMIGCLAAVYAALWQLQLVPGSSLDVPAPLAFGGVPGVRAVGLTLPEVGGPPPRASAQRATQPAAGAPSPAEAGPLPGIAQRLAIASIGLDTPVVAGGMLVNAQGALEWETVPNVAVHYAQLTALIGGPGNAVIAGHVSTLAQGNVFINLYKVQLGDEIQVWDQRDALHVFKVSGVQSVPPADTSVMDETPDSTLTLMTCGGTFDPIHREFSDRLIVSAKPA